MDKLLSFKKPAQVAATSSAVVVEEPPKKVIPLGPGTHKVHIWSRKVSNTKWSTTVEDLDEDLDLKRIARYMAKAFATSVAVCEHDDIPGKYYLKIQGNMKENVRSWLIENEVMTAKEAEERIVFHGV